MKKWFLVTCILSLTGCSVFLIIDLAFIIKNLTSKD